MDIPHKYREFGSGLEVIGEVPTRNVREEFMLIKDEYAEHIMRRIIPGSMFNELEGWARSYYTLEGHIKAISQYRRLKLPEPVDADWNATKQYVRHMFRSMPQCRTKSIYRLDEVKWLSSSSAGYGYVGLKGDNDNYRIARRTAYTIAQSILRGTDEMVAAIHDSTPDIAFTRTQLSQIKVKRKVRNVWGEAFHYVLLEGVFADNLISYFMSHETFYFIGKDPLVAVPALIQEILSEHDYVYQFDWTAFDASVQEWEIRFAFELLEELLIFDSPAEATLWRFIIELFIYRKVAVPNGELCLKTLGIPSGSCFTNMIGSIVNYVRIQYLFKLHSGDFTVCYTHGDDSLAAVKSNQRVNPGRFTPTCESLMWEFNPAKTAVGHVSEDVTFLSRTVRAGSNYRDELTCLRMLLYPEYPVTGGDISALRAWSIAKDSGLHSDLLIKIYRALNELYGTAGTLPFHLTKWNEIEYETLRHSYAEQL